MIYIHLIKVIRCDKYIPNTTSGTRNKTTYNYSLSAYTKVDYAEKEQDFAYRINAIGARNVAVASQLVGAKLVYISTDYVFQGARPDGYDEFHSPAPINIYGASKYAGSSSSKSYIINILSFAHRGYMVNMEIIS